MTEKIKRAFAVSLLLVGVAAFVPSLTHTEAVASASSHPCPVWTSFSVEPVYICVLNRQKHRVYKRPFRDYVAEVMASGEFPSRLPKPVLKAGALAVKQFAQFYVVHDRHLTYDGVSYNVENTTNDQLWKPRAHPTKRQISAVSYVWGLTLRKPAHGRFLTGYRAGASQKCAHDSNGWKLYARSAVNCAHIGLSWMQILRHYYWHIRFSWGPNTSSTLHRSKVN